jgi:hypothetical protein
MVRDAQGVRKIKSAKSAKDENLQPFELSEFPTKQRAATSLVDMKAKYPGGCVCQRV